ncbi:hypothetical protein F5984_01995 [Rudanella paleaurantiibacter]|uniref:Uncharacterized protein n=1 Tax=Rudanella paleaurantiibacter TaxID=2614655 RepID=A0A7J5U4Q1_9BACT|nr:hypothetical protein [Rudanella paleaurantiibacter]KAB7732745.1 hypothetical protein F5984_01995 [Rudanella paleaurantiibacter]
MKKRNGSVWALTLMTVVVMASCGERKTESGSATANSDSMSAVEQGNTPVMGMQGDTANSSTTGPTQAPPDSADGGAIVPANVNVRKE